jgi:hypothetical protein
MLKKVVRIKPLSFKDLIKYAYFNQRNKNLKTEAYKAPLNLASVFSDILNFRMVSEVGS